jgi:hypothetical protein
MDILRHFPHARSSQASIWQERNDAVVGPRDVHSTQPTSQPTTVAAHLVVIALGNT